MAINSVAAKLSDIIDKYPEKTAFSEAIVGDISKRLEDLLEQGRTGNNPDLGAIQESINKAKAYLA